MNEVLQAISGFVVATICPSVISEKKVFVKIGVQFHDGS